MAVADHLPFNFSQATTLIGPLLIGLIFFDYLYKRRLPPGPPSLPLLGNYLSTPRGKSWLFFTSLSKTYGGIYTFYSGLVPNIIISDLKSHTISSLVEAINTYYSQGSTIVTHPYGASWNMRRKIFHQFLKPSALQTYKERQEAEASKLVFGISLDEGKKWKDEIERYTSSVVFTLSYGRRIDALNSAVLKKRLFFVHYVARFLLSGQFLVESLPFLDYFPPFLARWKTAVTEMGKQNAAFDSWLVDTVRQDLAKNGGKLTGRGSLTENMILAAEAGNVDCQQLMQNERHFCGIPSSVFGAGSHTTIASLCSAVLGLILNPWVFVTAQKEIDEVIGKKRSPNFGDREKLPYIDALVKETLRWKPAIPMGVKHATSEDDIYEGYKILKGTMIVPNIWAMHYDPSYFPSPEEFAPERFLPENDERFREELKPEKEFPGKFGHGTFGWGRRICVGGDLAHNGMWIALVKLIWGLDLMGVEGEKYDGIKFTGDTVMAPASFKCRWKVRDTEIGHVIEREMSLAGVVLEQFPALE
ncbi:cytochrome P450 [Mollisia scopiformis]|uniref:Cytochrome P450 n=1 Tax=Mollisia scopiformis TaxID=149040 RepID=A0A194XK43_MOLSC|nr:cytochrome P450 [Mollisia scopiformis]KUJ20511.1 cytochrome P450 [Mollisia scopiformis]